MSQQHLRFCDGAPIVTTTGASVPSTERPPANAWDASRDRSNPPRVQSMASVAEGSPSFDRSLEGGPEALSPEGCVEQLANHVAGVRYELEGDPEYWDSKPSPEYSSNAVVRVLCAWCGVREVSRPGQLYCSNTCRQASYRLRTRSEFTASGPFERPMRLAYADPPFRGLAHLYREEASFAGEVDHVELVRSLNDSFDGWALATSSDALVDVLPLCPRGRFRIHPWVKPIGVSSRTWGAHSTWEALIVVPARRLRPGFRDWLCAMPARGGGTLIGRKPIAYCAHLFRALGADARDTLDDLYPGTGVIGRAWRTWVAAQQKEGKTNGSAERSSRRVA